MSAQASRWRSRSTLIAVLVVLAAAVLAALGASSTYVANDPEFCTSGCHEDSKQEHLAAAGHQEQGCKACHTINATTGLKLLATRLVGGNARHGQVDPNRCSDCHNDSRLSWVKIAATEGHRTHPTGVAAVDCLSCHRTTAHRDQSPQQTCLECHVSAPLHAKSDYDEAKQPECLTCHNFSDAKTTEGEREVKLTIDECIRCHSADAKPAQAPVKIIPASAIGSGVLHGTVDCKLCHQPHGKAHQGDGATRPCNSCHTIQLGHGGNIPEGHTACEGCHQQHKPLELAGSQCAECHEQARKRSDKAESTALRHDRCASCHLPHTFKAAPNECVSCHRETAALIFNKSPEPHQSCVRCHEVHGPPPNADTCGSCHKDKRGSLRVAPKKHQNCVSCHKPHSPKTQAPRACTECHKREVHQVVTAGPASHNKASCTGCHTVHSNPRASAAVCKGCHQDKSKLVSKARPAKHQNCASCHGAHTFRIAKPTTACAKCHGKIAESPGSHGGSCVKCHTPHGSPLVAQAQCQNCHRQIDLQPPPGAAPHAKCGSCHEPHVAAKAAVKRCASCHQDKARVAQKWPAGSAHREACNRCHQPHAVRQGTACGNCHAKQQAGARGGKHRCQQCHAPHQRPPAKKAGWWNRCSSCHSRQAKESRTHAACQKCHKPHDFKPPACTSCHSKIRADGLHAVKQHFSACTSCHEAHPASLPGRKECLSCHKDKMDHQPQARQCQSCHLF